MAAPLMTLGDLDAVVAKAETLEAFLNSPQLVDEYFNSCSDYYGHYRFDRKAYDTVLSQLAAVLTTEPALATRLWQPIDATAWNFRIQCDRALARDIHPAAWLSYLDDWSQRLTDEALPHYGEMNGLAFAQKAAPILQSACREITAFRTMLAQQKMSKKKEREASREFFEELTARPELISIAAYNLAKKLDQASVRSRLTCEDGDLVLAVLRGWRDHPIKLVLPELQSYAEPLLSLVRDRIPKMDDLTARTDLFPSRQSKTKSLELTESSALKKGVYQFEALPRRFHGLFRGLSINDCFSNVGPKADCHPARWLVAAVDEAQTIHIRSQARYYGSVLILPVTIKGQRFGLLEFWSSLLSSQAIIESASESGEAISSQIIGHRVITELTSRKPSSWSGLCYCDDPEFDNWAVIQIFKRELFAHFTTQIGVSEDLLLEDRVLSKAAEALPRAPKIARFPPGLIFSGRATKGLQVLQPDFEFDYN